MSAERKLVYLVSQYPAVNHTYILREIRQLRELGWQILPVSIRPDTRPAEKLTTEEKEEGSQTWYVKAQGLKGALQAHAGTLVTSPGRYLRGFALALRLAKLDLRKAALNLLYFTEALMVGRYMKSQRAAHAHTHFASTVGLFLRATFPVTLSMTIHGPAEFDDTAGFYLRQKIRASSFVLAISNYCRSQLMRASNYDQWQKFEVSPLGVNPHVFAPRPAPDSGTGAFELATVGLLAAVKGQHILIDAMAELRQQGRRVRLRIVGDGPERASLEQHISARKLNDSVRLEGPLNQDRVREIYRCTDAFVMGSFAEGVPVVLMEAMAMEIPCVTPWIMGVPELIEDGVDGLLVAPSDAAQLATAIARLMDDGELRLRIGQAARRKVQAKYDLEKNTANLAAIMQRRLAAPVARAERPG